jgi:hypothetical protein
VASLLKLPTHSDQSGSLTVIEKNLPFNIKRVYYIYNLNNEDRGFHRHKITKQALIANLINGRFFNLFKKRCHIYHHKKQLKSLENRQFIIDSSCFQKITNWTLFHNFKHNLNNTFDLLLKKI